jgi:methyl-accepting chemotaxis protein
MLRTLEKLGLKRSLYLAFGVALLVSAAAAVVAIGAVVRSSLLEGLVHHGESVVHSLAAELPAALEAGNVSRVKEEIEHDVRGAAIVWVVVLRADASVAASVMSATDAPGLEAIVESHRQARFAGMIRLPGVVAFSEPLVLAAPRPGETGKPVGRVLVGLSTRGVEESVARAQWTAALVLLSAAGLLAAIGWLLIPRLLFRPIAEMQGVARRMADRNLSARAATRAQDELGQLATSLNQIGENLAATVGQLEGVMAGVNEVIGRIKKTGSVVAEGVGTVTARVLDTSASMERMIEGFKGIADSVETLAQSADESSSSILEMAATNDEVVENIQALAASVEETTAAIEQMTTSIKDVAQNIDDLSATAEETSSSMNEMDVSISQVESNANETAKLSEQAQRDAEVGAEALSRTIAGIHKIKGSSEEAASVIEVLGQKIAVIGNILNVIDDVAEQTNLLALNAAILAAQSGEHGKGFAVVADEIKDLAERTGASTKEISDLVRSVQEESKNAIHAMNRGVRAVEEGVRLGQDAEGALKKIQESSQKSTQMVKAIARATIEQARGSKQVTMAINRIATTVGQIAAATSEQARGSEQIMKSAEKMKIITKHVERSSQEQARGSKQITRSIESISEMVNHLNRSQKDQSRSSEQVMQAVVQIQQVAEAQTYSVRELEAAIVDLASQAQVLAGEVKRFKVS